ncbi:helix-turn-helix transcriptional regulator [Citrobacter koseri]|uniref:helix-turn-helix transcriptional regulator n=1 Tax=Citrobacter koseri TaxID=545 RepID=UPI001B9DDAF3|nr:hypothetical protein [Citrobacter koseri]
MITTPLDQFALSGLNELVKSIIPATEQRRMLFVQDIDLITACYCRQLSDDVVIIPLSSWGTSSCGIISLQDNTSDIREALKRTLQRKSDETCRYCQLISELTLRELGIIRLMKYSDSMPGVRLMTRISRKTVYTHQSNIRKKTGFRTRSQFLAWCKAVSGSLTI